jgi:hypothetical protein
MSEQTSTQIANLALTHCGVSKPIQDLDTDHSLEAQMCLTWYDTARRTTLKKIPWSFSTKQIAPALVANMPTNEWLYAYQYPQDALKITRFMSWRLNNDTRQSRVPYRVMQPVDIGLSTLQPAPTTPYAQTTGLWIYTNWPGVNIGLPVVLEYTFDNANIAQWPDDFNMAFSLVLASLIVTTLTTGNPQQQQQTIQANLDKAINASSADNLNEEQRPQEPQSEFIRARSGDMGYGYPGMTWVAEAAGFAIQ